MIVAREKTEYYGLPEKPSRSRRPRKGAAMRGLLRKERLALTGLVLLGFSCCLVIAFYYTQVLITGYRISMAEKELARLRVESHDLYTEVNQLASLENIEAIAVHELGMVKPQNDRIVIVEQAGPVKQQAVASNDAEDGQAETVTLNDPKEEQQRGQNWLIKTFADMVGKLEASIQTG
ncbi:cell division protein FtsL [Desulfallas thermosapovorans]|uniref:Cell division protein FtsL n=1 Tax=Desulfallas thermosapovorans DSM 6562 TaxID=1121431 RepID=A0A5S4ZUZ9_9FIRM|nr:cell division protein FtsL [Desulfallas thermosapovorans]TYO95922.1 cell division protein FtsL [Desulfallas thermosapovorans DSM 6562]